jgi:GT2 family glycosyltransferase
MYKEDIELGMRLRKLGFSIMYDSSLVAYHCRGWQATRKKMAPALRLHAARNEVLLYRKHPSPYMLWALGKYLLVRFLGA